MNSNDVTAVAREAMAMRRAMQGGQPQPMPLDRGLKAMVFLFVWTVVSGLGLLIGGGVGGAAGAPVGFGFATFFGFFIALWASAVVRIAAQWERSVVLRFGKFHATKGPGLLFVFPVADSVSMVDTRLLTMPIPKQQVITRDNVPVSIDGALFFQVRDPERAVTTVQDYRSAILQYAQASLRDVAGGMSLDDLLSEREKIQEQIAQTVESRSTAWGIHVDAIRLLDIDMPEDLKKMMSRQASAEREKRATITKAEGDRDAALNLAQAARTMIEAPGAMQLRTLQTLDGLGSSPSNTVVLAVPVEVLELARRLGVTVPGSKT
ncbi:MAG: slipin family protein [Archangium sp.]|nr:slipin family protein [Archangium sp.]